MQGKIVKALSGFYYTDTEDGIYTCRGRGKLRRLGITPLVGDIVEFSIAGEHEGAIDKILERKNEFDRPAVSNIDQLVIIASNAIPVTDPFLIDRITSIAALKNCEVAIIINKVDLDPADDLTSIYKDLPYHLIKASALNNEGIDDIRKLCAGKVSAFTGNSGVGKSSIINALLPSLELKTDEVSKALGRGKHTTRHVEMFRISEGSYIIDTPGFSSLDSTELALELKEKLETTFPEFQDYLGECRYVGCSHMKEKGCAVLGALKAGKINPNRHKSYQRLYNELKDLNVWSDKSRS